MCSQSPGYSQPNKTHVYSRDITTRRILCASKHIHTLCSLFPPSCESAIPARRDTERRDSFTRGVTASPKGAVIDIGGRARRTRERKRRETTVSSSRNVTNMAWICVSLCAALPSCLDFFVVAKVNSPAPRFSFHKAKGKINSTG